LPPSFTFSNPTMNNLRQYTQTITIPQQISQPLQHQLSSRWTTTTTTHPSISIPQPQSIPTNNLFSFGQDQPLFDYHQPTYPSSPSQALMQPEHTHNSWLDNGQLTPRSTTRAHHRESSLSSLGSAGPASPYTANTSNPQVVGDLYHDFHDFHHNTKPLTPVHTPSQEHFITPHYSNFYHNSHLAYTMGDGMVKQTGDAELMPAPEFNHSGRPSITSVASHDSPSTPPSYEEERQKNVYRSSVPKLDRTMTDIYADELYNPSFQITSAAPTSTPSIAVSPQNDVFSQRLQAATSQHLSANTQTPLTIPSRERSPFRQGSPLAPSGSSFGTQSPNVRFGTATHMREQQKLENDARALQQQLERTSPEHTTPKTISPKDVDLVYHENEEDAKTPLFPPQQSQHQTYQKQAPSVQSDDNTSQRSYSSMATSRRESSAYSNSSTPQQSSFNFAPPAVPGNVRIPQQYPFVPQARRQPSNLSNVTEEFPATLTSMESSSSEYAPESETRKPAGASADTGTYSCTYRNCSLRFDSPQKLQRHKREGHRNSAPEEGGMTSRNSQAGPHKCERINPSTGKPCNSIFSRPYDLTRHEDTIHNPRKQKLSCPFCVEEKLFSRSDAMSRHIRVIHSDKIPDHSAKRRGGRS
jgi:hypothetical protein